MIKSIIRYWYCYAKTCILIKRMSNWLIPSAFPWVCNMSNYRRLLNHVILISEERGEVSIFKKPECYGWLTHTADSIKYSNMLSIMLEIEKVHCSRKAWQNLAWLQHVFFWHYAFACYKRFLQNAEGIAMKKQQKTCCCFPPIPPPPTKQ